MTTTTNAWINHKIMSEHLYLSGYNKNPSVDLRTNEGIGGVGPYLIITSWTSIEKKHASKNHKTYSLEYFQTPPCHINYH